MITRNNAVDALRGIAAAAVLIDHTMAAFPLFGGGAKTPLPFVQAIINSPLHVLWDGGAAVILFFVLSGYSLATLASKSVGRWRYYFASRLVRLYLPVVFAVALGWVFIQFRPASDKVDSLWSIRPPTFTPLMAFQDMTLVHLSGEIGPLWSLQWEVIFSLALPVVLLVLKNMPKWVAWVLAGISLFVGLQASNPWATYIPIFVMGVLMKQNEAALRDRASKSRIGDRTRFAFALFLAFAMASVPWVLGPYDSVFNSSVMTTGLRVLSSVIVLGLAMTNEALQLALRRRIFAFLGLISFSLYLTHEPLVISLYRYLHGSLAAVPLSMLLSLALGWLFYLTVEKQAHALSRRIFKLGVDRQH